METLIIVSVDAPTGNIVVQRGEKEVRFSIEQLEELFTLADRVYELEERQV